jgi:hypothetical protein
VVPPHRRHSRFQWLVSGGCHAVCRCPAYRVTRARPRPEQGPSLRSRSREGMCPKNVGAGQARRGARATRHRHRTAIWHVAPRRPTRRGFFTGQLATADRSRTRRPTGAMERPFFFFSRGIGRGGGGGFKKKSGLRAEGASSLWLWLWLWLSDGGWGRLIIQGELLADIGHIGHKKQ